MAELTRVIWKVDRHIIASLKTKKMSTAGLRKLFISVENLGEKINLLTSKIASEIH